MDKYYVKVVGRAFGPLGYEKVCGMLANGRIMAGTEISTDAQNWRRASSFPEFRKLLHDAYGECDATPDLTLVEEPDVLPSAASGSALWYVRTHDGRQNGPVTVEQIREALRAGRFSSATHAWRLGEQERELRNISEFREDASASVLSLAEPAEDDLVLVEESQTDDLLPAATPQTSSDPFEEALQTNRSVDRSPLEEPPPASGSPPEEAPSATGFSGASNEFHVPELSSCRKRNRALQIWHGRLLVGFVALTTVRILLFTVSKGTALLGSYEGASVGVSVMVNALRLLNWAGIGVGVFFAVSILFFVHAFWASIPDDRRQTSPIKATLLLVVPFFNLYWSYVAFCQGSLNVDLALTDYFNRGLSRGGGPKRAGFVSGAVCAVYFDVTIIVSAILSAVKIEGLFFLVILAPLILYLFSFRMKNAAVQLNSWREDVE